MAALIRLMQLHSVSAPFNFPSPFLTQKQKALGHAWFDRGLYFTMGKHDFTAIFDLSKA